MDAKVKQKFPTKLFEVPEMGNDPLPVKPFVSAEYFQQEKEKIFKQAWLEVGRLDHIPNVGDYFLAEIEMFGWSIIVIRGKDNQVRAFHNACTHRGMKVAKEPRGNKKGFRCEFHGWTFSIDGELAHMNGEEYFPNAKPCDLNLRPVTMDTWNGFVFLHYQKEPAQPLREFLGGMADQLEAFPYDEYTHIARYTANPKVNWKLAADAFQEAYHVEWVHRNSIPNSCNGVDNPNGAPTSARMHGPHRSISAWVNPEYRASPTGMLAWKHGVSIDPGGTQVTPGANPSGDNQWWFDINVFFPNFFCDVGPGYYFTYNFWPVSENETRWVLDTYQMKAKDAGERFAQEHTKVLLRDGVLEDFSTLEATQESLESGALNETGLQIGELEVACRHQLWIVEQWLNR